MAYQSNLYRTCYGDWPFLRDGTASGSDDRRRRVLLVFDVEVKCYRPETESALKMSLVQPSAPRCANGALLKYRLGSISELGILESAVWGKHYYTFFRRRRMGFAADRCVISGRVEHQY